MTKNSIYKERKICRICNSSNLINYIDFGEMPIATSFKKPEEPQDARIPLGVNFCKDCGLSQLNVVVDPFYLFSNYPYNSSVSKTFQEHCFEMSKSLKKLFGNREGIRVLDIASNDGCLLKEFKKNGYKVVGVDPARNLAEKANRDGIETICAFWDKDIAKEVVNKIGKIDIVIATNVFAHVDDVHGFIECAKETMLDDGIFVIEFGYAKNLIRYNEFDTILHEHLSYYLVTPLVKLFSMHGMQISDIVEFKNIHGGSLRVITVKNDNNKISINKEIVYRYLRDEEANGLLSIEPYFKLEKNASKIRLEIQEIIREIRRKGEVVAGYGAPVKGNTFVNYCRLNKEDIPFIIDDTKDKQGLVYAGTGIPIVPSEWIKKEKPKYLFILAWNFADEIMNKTQEFKDADGKYIIAIPKPRIV